jgi:hypothetical protein
MKEDLYQRAHAAIAAGGDQGPLIAELWQAMQEQHNHLEVERANVGANICANILRDIAEHGRRRGGVFGGEDIELAAQVIAKLYRFRQCVLATLKKLHTRVPRAATTTE